MENIWNELNQIINKLEQGNKKCFRIEVIANYENGKGVVQLDYYKQDDEGNLVIDPDTDNPKEGFITRQVDIWKPAGEEV